MRARSKIGDIVLPKYNVHLGHEWRPVTDELAEKLKGTNFVELEGEQKKKAEVDINNMTKDELLDYTAIKGIDADYKMTKKEIKELIRK